MVYVARQLSIERYLMHGGGLYNASVGGRGYIEHGTYCKAVVYSTVPVAGRWCIVQFLLQER